MKTKKSIEKKKSPAQKSSPVQKKSPVQGKKKTPVQGKKKKKKTTRLSGHRHHGVAVDGCIGLVVDEADEVRGADEEEVAGTKLLLAPPPLLLARPLLALPAQPPQTLTLKTLTTLKKSKVLRKKKSQVQS